MKPALLLCFLLLAAPAFARLGETTEQIEARYGKPTKTAKPESPATDAKVYEKNGFRITVGYYEGKSYYEQFGKPELKEPHYFQEITETERKWLAKANNLQPIGGYRMVTAQDGTQHEEWQYFSLDRQSEGTYALKVLTIRSLLVEKQIEANEKKREEDNLKDF
jgi:hypothetical protein